jgi:hypothetical protein
MTGRICAGNSGRHQGRSNDVRPDLRFELLHRAERLQAAHAERDREAVSEVEADNVAWLRSVVAEIGWPGRSMVGSDGADAALMLAQNTGRDHVFQRHCLDLLRRAAEAGEAAPAQVAYLTDRILLAEGHQQEYGTELTGRDGQWLAPRLRDPANVDERRATLSLEPLADHIASLTAQHGPPKPSVIACAECGTAIEVWLPDLGNEQTVDCAACGWTVRLTAGASPDT